MSREKISPAFTHWSFSGYITAILCCCIAGLALTRITRWIQNFKILRSLPTPSYSRIYGTLDLMFNEKLYFEMLLNKFAKDVHPKMCCIWLGPFKGELVLYHPKTIKTVLMNSAAWKSRGFGKAYENGVPWVGEGMVTANGEQWARARNLLQPAFHLNLLKNYMPVFNQCADRLLEVLDRYAKSGESVDLKPLLTKCSLEVVMRCVMGYYADIQGYDGVFPYVKAAGEMADIWVERYWKPYLYPDWIFRRSAMGKKFYKNCAIVHQTAEKVIAARKTALDTGYKPDDKHMIFLDILLRARDDDGQPMSMLEIRNQVDTLMFAGHDTSTSGLIFNVYNLARHQSYQEKVRDEVDRLIHGRDSNEIVWEDLNNLTTLALCSKESKRLFPPGPLINRMLVKDVEIDGKIIPAGTTMMLSILSMHRHPDLWHKPNEYIPERFLNDDFDKDAYIPFSAGPRNCLGQVFGGCSEKVILSKIFNRYEVTLAVDEEIDLKPLALVLKPRNGLWIKLKKRKQ